MNAPPISRYPIPQLDDLPADIRARILEVQEKSGFIPNVFLALAHRPAEWRAFFAYHDALMERDSGLSKAEREMIVVATSNANGCQYCVVAHGATPSEARSACTSSGPSLRCGVSELLALCTRPW